MVRHPPLLPVSAPEVTRDDRSRSRPRIARPDGHDRDRERFEVAARARALEAQGRSIIHLQIGEPDFDTPANVREAAKRALDDGRDALRAVRRASRPCARRSPPTRRPARASRSTPSQVFVTVGGKGVMLYAILGLVDPGDEVLVPDPGYPIYESLTRFVGGDAGARSRSGWRTTSGSTSTSSPRSITPRTRMLVINSPANPTGGVLTRDDLERDRRARDPSTTCGSSPTRSTAGSCTTARSTSRSRRCPGMAERTIVLDGFSQDLRDDRLAAGLRDRAAVARRRPTAS